MVKARIAKVNHVSWLPAHSLLPDAKILLSFEFSGSNAIHTWIILRTEEISPSSLGPGVAELWNLTGIHCLN